MRATRVDDKAASGASARQWRWIKFECHADPGSEVFIAGTFNNWKPSGLHKLRDGNRDGTFGTLLKLRRGRHEYKFLVNGQWASDCQDPARNRVMEVA
jgi:1,4-alpha-glucan branching enzyme